uniref:Uncharacterized protein n=1 Tax=Brassica oleracea TaxID=3712 RepID=A0A3P6DXI9_BRAOL|nr:unnamed protein product [Brassica oleracea]
MARRLNDAHNCTLIVTTLRPQKLISRGRKFTTLLIISR